MSINFPVSNKPLSHRHFERATMGGDSAIFEGPNHGQLHGRIYTPFGSSDSLRQRISDEGQHRFGAGYRAVGEEYNDQLGGFFRTITTMDNGHLFNCYQYAIGCFGERLERLVGQDMPTIQRSISVEVESFINKYFRNVREPKDGDLVVYMVPPGESLPVANERTISGITHLGIYRNSEPNWHSPKGGTVESKFGWLGAPEIFQHDFFCVPSFYGPWVIMYELNEPDAPIVENAQEEKAE